MGLDAELLGEHAGVVLRGVGGIRRRHYGGADALSAERVRSETGHECRVNPAGETEDHMRETVLLDIVTEPERQRAVDLRLDRLDRPVHGIEQPVARCLLWRTGGWSRQRPKDGD